MYQDLIKELQPKPKFNLNWYKNSDLYSDGQIEDTLIEFIADSPVEDYNDIIFNNYNWPVYYYLSPLRTNILNWYPFKEDSSVLEIGCGLGAITNMLCDRCKDVTAVELSKKRATATLLRCRERDNLEIIVGNLNDIQFEKKFDYITLIGVLEYQGTFTDTDNPFQDFLKKIKNLLKDGGKLLVAIENKYGLKYWCGSKEDHTGFPFDGMNQYNIGNHNAHTFSKEELNKILNSSGFDNTYFYYPYPDYKLPVVIYSQNYLPTSEKMENVKPYYIPDNDTVVINELGVYKDIIENNVFEFFSNSFLVECTSENSNTGEVLFALTNLERKSEYRTVTSIYDQKVKKVFSMEEKAILCCNAHSILIERGLNALPMERDGKTLIMKRMKLPTLEDKVVKYIDEKNIKAVYELFDILLSQIEMSSEFNDGENLLYELNLLEPSADYNFGKILKQCSFDMIARNAFVDEDKIIWFDQEYMLHNVPSNFVVFRNILQIYNSYPYVSEQITLDEFASRYIDEELWQAYIQLESMICSSIIDMRHASVSSSLKAISTDKIKQNISKLYIKLADNDGSNSNEQQSEEIISQINFLLKKEKYEEIILAFRDMSAEEFKNSSLGVFIKLIQEKKDGELFKLFDKYKEFHNIVETII